VVTTSCQSYPSLKAPTLRQQVLSLASLRPYALVPVNLRPRPQMLSPLQTFRALENMKQTQVVLIGQRVAPPPVRFTIQINNSTSAPMKAISIQNPSCRSPAPDPKSPLKRLSTCKTNSPQACGPFSSVRIISLVNGD